MKLISFYFGLIILNLLKYFLFDFLYFQTHTALLLSETYHLRDREERLVSYLPLSHVAANILDIFVVMTAQSATYFADKVLIRL